MTVTGTLHILDHTGDTQLKWDTADKMSVEEVRERFDALRRQGYLGYTVEGDTGEVIREFEPEAHRIVMSRPIAGG